MTVVEDHLELGKTRADADLFRLSFARIAENGDKILTQRGVRSVGFMIPVKPLDDLLAGQRDQDADDDDPDFIQQLLPAVERLGHVEMHRGVPTRRCPLLPAIGSASRPGGRGGSTALLRRTAASPRRRDALHPAAMSLAASLAAGAALTTLIVAARYFVVSGTLAAVTLARHPAAGPAPARRRAQVRREIAWSMLAALIYGVPAGVVVILWQRGGTAIYAGAPHGVLGWLALPASALAYLLVHDTWFYWSHRWMHRPAVFARVHAVHHASRPPTAWAAMSFHWTEALSGAVVVPLLALVVPIHAAALLAVLTIMTWNGVINHMGWEIYPRDWVSGWFGGVVITPSHHDLHHRNYRCNYGLYFRFWDRVGGTDRGWQIPGDPPERAA